MTDPHYSNEHGLFADTVCIECIRHLLHLVVGFNNLRFRAVLDHNDLFEAPNIFEKVVGILAILVCIFPSQTLSICIDEYKTNFFLCYIFFEEDFGFLYSVRGDVGEASISMHLLKHLWELNREGLVVKSPDEGLEERSDHVDAS